MIWQGNIPVTLFFSSSDNRGQQFFETPLLFNIEIDPEETSPLPHVEHSELLANFSEALNEHMKTRRNKWRSQLDSRIVPFWFPCANFPHCFQTCNENSDFSDLFTWWTSCAMWWIKTWRLSTVCWTNRPCSKQSTVKTGLQFLKDCQLNFSVSLVIMLVKNCKEKMDNYGKSGGLMVSATGLWI